MSCRLCVAVNELRVVPHASLGVDGTSLGRTCPESDVHQL